MKIDLNAQEEPVSRDKKIYAIVMSSCLYHFILTQDNCIDSVGMIVRFHVR